MSAREFTELVAIALGVFFLIAAVLQAGQLARAALAVVNQVYGRNTLLAGPPLPEDLYPPLSLVVAAHNERTTIGDTVDSLLGVDYAYFDVIVVDDGSDDGMLDVLRERYALEQVADRTEEALPSAPIRAVYRSALERRLLVIAKERGGKADALNAGISTSRYPLVCSVDADCVLEPSALRVIVDPMIRSSSTVATGGIVRVLNGSAVVDGRVVEPRLSRRSVVGIQVVEYLRGFLLGRTAWSATGALLIIAGAFAVFRRDAVVAVGGFARGVVGEDAELVTRLHHHAIDHGRRAQITFVPDPVCWTEVPSSIGGLRRQRMRWQQGLIETLRLHRALAFRRGSGTVGWFAYPYAFAVEFLGPVLEIVALPLILLTWLTGVVTSGEAVLLLLLGLGLGAVFSSCALIIEQTIYRTYRRRSEMARLIWFALLEATVFHQLIAIWRVEGTIAAYRRRDRWVPPRRSVAERGR